MNKPHPELSRPVDASRIPETGATETIIADPKECALIAQRLGLPAIWALTAELALSRWRGKGVKVAGTIAAEVEQICVVTLDPFRVKISDQVERYFLPDAGPAEEDADIDGFDDGVIELGEVVIESLSLALDPYPRKPGAVFADEGAASPLTGDSPFAALAGLKARKP
jgi:uncharacterized metal-binding protein YceD (DUF177 family)